MLPTAIATTAGIAERYRRFALREAGARSPAWRALGLAVADDPALAGFVAALPPDRRQPNLVLACARLLLRRVPTAGDLAALIAERPEALRAEILTRRTQTNEPARCATLLPWLADLPQPLALIEVGASAGLCLFPDRYAYDYGGGHVLRPAGVADPPLHCCRLGPGLVAPARLPRVAWRAGLDLAPLDPAAPETRDWLSALVWPGHEDRLPGLHRALDLAAAEPAVVHQGDLRGPLLGRLLDSVPAGMTTVVFHTAVLAYLDDPAAGRAFADAVMARADVWIAAEGPAVLPWIADRAGTRPGPDRFLVSRNGVPMAWADPHGAALEPLV